MLAIGTLAIPAFAGDAGLPPGFVRLSDVTRSMRQDIRYAGSNNFMGRSAAGYGAGECWLRREAALALADVAHDLARAGWRLVVYDCYRPKRAVSDFLAWARDRNALGRKGEYYPTIDKGELFARGYIAAFSSHSRGIAVDAGAEALDTSSHVAPLDFGTGFDRFDPRSWTASRAISAGARANRRRFTAAFATHGFANYAREWWHFSYRALAGAPAYDVPITAAASGQ
jgi:zinc D-Ala-D-Ala dipeptidase